MFILTSDANSTGNSRLRDYANALASPKAFIAPYATTSTHLVTPNGFNANATGWSVIYGFKWEDGNYDGECDSSSCYYMPSAHNMKFLTRAYDVDDFLEADFASAKYRGGTWGAANFIAVDYPWQSGGTGGYGSYPEGSYPE